MASMVFSSADRDAAYQELERIQESNSFSECREDPNSDKPYQVWDGPREWTQTPLSEWEKELLRKSKEAAAGEEPKIHFTNDQLDAIGAAFAKHMKGQDS